MGVGPWIPEIIFSPKVDPILPKYGDFWPFLLADRPALHTQKNACFSQKAITSPKMWLQTPTPWPQVPKTFAQVPKILASRLENGPTWPTHEWSNTPFLSQCVISSIECMGLVGKQAENR